MISGDTEEPRQEAAAFSRPSDGGSRTPVSEGVVKRPSLLRRGGGAEAGLQAGLGVFLSPLTPPTSDAHLITYSTITDSDNCFSLKSFFLIHWLFHLFG